MCNPKRNPGYEDGEFEQREAYLKRLADDFASEDDFDDEDPEDDWEFDDEFSDPDAY